MARAELDAKLEEIRSQRSELMALLQDTDDRHADLSTEEWSFWGTVGVLFLRFGDHMREHTSQIVGARQALGADMTDTQRKLAEAQRAWGQLLGAVVGLTDEDLDRVPEEGSWTIRETLDHILMAETRYKQALQNGLREGRQS